MAKMNEFRDTSKADLVAEVLELRATARVHTRSKSIDAAARTVQVLGRYISTLASVYFISTAVMAFAGKDTTLNATVGVDASAVVSIKQLEALKQDYTRATLLFAFFGAAGLAYGIGQKNLRESTVRRLHPYQLEFEKARHPQRSSSALTPSGGTRPGDK